MEAGLEDLLGEALFTHSLQGGTLEKAQNEKDLKIYVRKIDQVSTETTKMICATLLG